MRPDPMPSQLPEITIIGSTRPLARAEHICTICNTPIAIGTRYSRHLIRNHDALDRKKALQVVKWHLPLCPVEEKP